MNKKNQLSGVWSAREIEMAFSIKAASSNTTSTEIANILHAQGFPKRTPAAIRGMLGRNKDITTYIEEDEEIFSSCDLLINAQPKSEKIKLKKDFEFISKLQDIKEKAIRNSDYLYGNIGIPKTKANIKILVLSDLHIPLHNERVLNHALKFHQDADFLVINGDFLDLYSVSQWTKNKTIPLIEEYRAGMKILKKLSEIFPRVYLTEGNHEDRLQRYFSSRIDLNVSFMTESDVLHRLSRGFDFDEYGELCKTHDLKNVVYTKGQQSWYLQIGKCIFAHPTGSSGIPMRTAIKTAEWFIGRDINFEAVVVAHTHKMGSIIWNNKLLIEQGCACAPMEYEATSKMNYKPQTTGYAVIMMNKEGHVDFNKSKTVYLGTGSSIDPDTCLINI